MTLAHCRVCGDEGGNREDRTQEIYKLEVLLPAEYHHEICSYEAVGQDDDSRFNCLLRLEVTTEEEVQQWLVAFQRSSCLTWRKSKTYPAAGRYNKYRVDLRCQHNTRYKSAIPGKMTKNTDCPATMTLVLKRRVTNSKSQDLHIHNGLLFSVRLRNDHNHHIACADAFRRRDVSEDCVGKLKDLFEHGHSPSSALDTLKHDLQEDHGEQYVYATVDRSVCPDLQFCYRLYFKIFKKAYEAPSGEEMFVDLEERLHTYNEEQQETCAKIKHTEDSQTVVAICTPLMKRVHTMVEQSGEMIFFESSGKCHRHNSRIFVLLTHSSAGGLPLGVLLTSSESQPTITAGIELLKSILPDSAFFGREAHGPLVAVTDDCLALCQAIHSVYPQTSLILGVFHILRAMWRWLWDGRNGISKQDRPHLLGVFKSLVYAESSDRLNNLYQAIVDDPIVKKYRKYTKHLASVFETREAWAVCFWSNLFASGNNAADCVESAMRIMKDKVLYHFKAYNVTQSVDFLLTRMESYYTRRLLDVVNNCTANIQQSRYFLSDDDINCRNIVQEDETSYSVPSTKSGELYHVDISIGTCTCPVGKTGGPCQHQHAVMKTFNVVDCNFMPTTSPHLRELYYTIATGRDYIKEEWFMNPCHESDSPPPVDATTPPPTADVSVLQNPQIRFDFFHLQRAAENGFQNCGTSSRPTEDQDVLGKLRNMFDTLSQKMNDDPDMFRFPIKSFVSRFEKIASDSALISALLTFAKYSTFSAARQIKIRAKKRLPISSRVGMQPTTVTRRKTPLGGRRALITGRPPKSSRQTEHGYAKQRASTNSVKRGALPKLKLSAFPSQSV
ncbi:uncharacterized protein LOC110986198 [Acanthaster planci]|uniref:Uncharacterized protein LOC110986198 n=1 Tax=Acanthaster planci TaxID=133434 RepID=A0A8B7ZF12_ACAPL|nr:uncharacterized protein LOC110986198 [Acanthaster planci]